MTPRLDAAARAIERDRGEDLRDLADLRVAALAFKLAVGGPHPIAVAYAVDDEGVEHWLSVRATNGAGGVEATYVLLLSDLLRRGLTVSKPLIVDSNGCLGLARRLELALGPVVHAGMARECGGSGMAW
jgi:hypothetical protein